MGAIMGTVERLSQRRKDLRVRRKSEVAPSVCRARWLWAHGRLSQAIRSCVQSLLVWCLMDSTVTGRRRWRQCALDKAAVKSANAPTNRDHWRGQIRSGAGGERSQAAAYQVGA